VNEALELPANFAFYGTLRVGGAALSRLGLEAAVRHLGPCRIPGRLHVVSWYPGLVPGEGEVIGDLFEVTDRTTVALLDRFEGFDPEDPDRSLFMRTPVELIAPATEAWVYRWRGDPTQAPVAVSGDWLDRDG
jgi:gamma-glutamylcyclotransferase (GGCT)/AIG2-like uncharacterized protein YtfP